MKQPDFWNKRGGLLLLLMPAALIWTFVGRLKRKLARPYTPSIPVLCVGNVNVGGTGKTPVSLSIGRMLLEKGLKVAYLSRGYGGSEVGPLQVDPEVHTSAEVGDEPLLLGRLAPTIVARDRVAGAKALEALGAEVILMDDGLQNPSVTKTASLMVVDGAVGFRNRKVMPAGPLREPLRDALARVDAVVRIGPDISNSGRWLRDLPVFGARFEPTASTLDLNGKAVLGFAGIGRPEKFAETLVEIGAKLVDFVAFDDHAPYTPEAMMALVEQAEAQDAVLVTTEKDLVRLPIEARAMVTPVPISLAWENQEAIEELLKTRLGF